MLSSLLVLVPHAFPAWFWKQALCIHVHESSNWHAVNPPYYGGMQFTLGTFKSVGGSGLPSNVSPHEQIYRAYIVWKRDGGSWREWPTSSRLCGLR